jgi:hypothetical protein
MVRGACVLNNGVACPWNKGGVCGAMHARMRMCFILARVHPVAPSAVITVAMQPLFHFGMWLVRKGYQSCVVSCSPDSNQDTYNAAWMGQEFALDYRQGTAGLHAVALQGHWRMSSPTMCCLVQVLPLPC